MSKRKGSAAVGVSFRHSDHIRNIQSRLKEDGLSNAEKLCFRNLSIREGSIKVDDNSGEVTGTAVVASSYPVSREVYVSGEGWVVVDEIISMDGIDTETRGGNGAIPLLKDHRWNVDNQIGAWSNFRVDPQDPSQMLADFRISPDDDAKTIRQRIAGGYIKSFSSGYEPTRTVLEEVDGKYILRVLECELYEVSAVAVPADPRSTSRAHKGVGKMSVKNKNGKAAPKSIRTIDVEIQDGVENDDINLNEDENDDEGNEDAVGERQENDDAIVVRCRTLGIPKSFYRSYLGTDTSPAQVVRKYRATTAAKDAKETETVNSQTAEIVVGGQRSAEIRQVAKALTIAERAASLKTQAEYPAEITQALSGFRSFDLSAGLNHKQILRYCAERHNVGLPNDIDETTIFEIRSVAPAVISDYLHVLNTSIRTLTPTQEPLPYLGALFTRAETFTTFEGGRFVGGLEIEEMLTLGAGGEIKAGGHKVFDTQGVMETIGRRWSIGRTLFTANGIGLFSDLNIKIQNAATIARNKMLIKKVLSNPLMSDNVPFYNGEARYNVATNVPLTIAGMGLVDAVASSDGTMVPYTIALCHPLNVTALKQLNGNWQATEPSKAKAYGEFSPIAIPGMPLDMVIWLKDPRIVPAYLDLSAVGQDVPLQTIVETAQYDGFELKAVKDVGVANGDPKGALITFTGAEPAQLPNGEPANYDAVDIEDLIDLRAAIDWSE